MRTVWCSSPSYEPRRIAASPPPARGAVQRTRASPLPLITQRARVRLVLLDPPPQRALMVGARATVQLYPEHGIAAAVARVFGWAQIRALAVLHYLY